MANNTKILVSGKINFSMARHFLFYKMRKTDFEIPDVKKVRIENMPTEPIVLFVFLDTYCI